MNDTNRYLYVVNPGSDLGMAFFNCGEFEQLTSGIERQEAHALDSDARRTHTGRMAEMLRNIARRLTTTYLRCKTLVVGNVA